VIGRPAAGADADPMRRRLLAVTAVAAALLTTTGCSLGEKGRLRSALEDVAPGITTDAVRCTWSPAVIESASYSCETYVAGDLESVVRGLARRARRTGFVLYCLRIQSHV
jgi:hypothetical protein